MWIERGGRAAVRALRKHAGLTPPGRGVRIRPDDVILVSYPRSGNTWVRFLLANVLYPETTVTFANIGSFIPDIYMHSRRVISHLDGRRLLKSHEYFDPRYPRVIYVVRHPEDVIVSTFHYRLRMGNLDESYPLSRFVDDFISLGWTEYGTWGEHVGSWMGARFGVREGRFLLVKYEDLIDDPAVWVARMAVFAGILTDREAVSLAVERSRFERMREHEKRASTHLQPSAVMRHERFIRGGKVGEGREQLGASDREAIAAAWKIQLGWVGYTQ